MLWPDTFEPYTGAEILYQAPPRIGADVGDLPPFRLPVGAAVSDGAELVWVFGMAEVIEAADPGGGEDVGVADADVGGDPDATEDLGVRPEAAQPTGALAGSSASRESTRCVGCGPRWPLPRCA